MEIWKIAKDNKLKENRYLVSNYGRLKDTKTGFIFISRSNIHKGYIQLSLFCKDNKKRRFLLHRIVAQTFLKNPNNFPIINHIDEDRQNNKIDNLEWCSQKHNMLCWAANHYKK